jgi:hypothetical protein
MIIKKCGKIKPRWKKLGGGTMRFKLTKLTTSLTGGLFLQFAGEFRWVHYKKIWLQETCKERRHLRTHNELVDSTWQNSAHVGEHSVMFKMR